jgi:hypothetical protein
MLWLVALLALLALLAIVLLAAQLYLDQRRFHRPLLTTPYQRVTLQDGSVYYGRIDHLGTDHPVLRDAMTIRQEKGVTPAEPQYVLTRRKDEPHGADHIIFPAVSIVFVEPVRPDSPIGQVIAASEKRP